MGTARVKLVATDIANVEMASAEAEIEVNNTVIAFLTFASI